MPPKTKTTPDEVKASLEHPVDNSTKRHKLSRRAMRNEFFKAIAPKPDFER